MSPNDNQVVVLVPGTMGSELEDSEGNLWPGDLSDWLFGYSDSKFTRLCAIPLQVGGILRKVLIVGIYDHIMDDLEDCGYRESDSPPTLYTCPYDWRRPAQVTVAGLADVVDVARADHGADVDIILIGHSQGGLLCRYYLESGTYDARPGFGSVRQLILIGVPNFGLPLMLTMARGEQDRLFLSEDQIQTLASTDGLSSAYVMLPAPAARKIWHNTGALPWAPYDLLNPAAASSVGLTSAANLADAVTYRATMDAGSRPPGVRYFSFVGTRKDTFVGAIIDTSNPADLPLPLEKITRDDAGDGTVPDWSAWLPDAQGLAVGGKHTVLFKDNTLRKALAVLLGCDSEQTLMRISSVELQISDLVVAPAAELGIDLIFDREDPPADPELELLLLQAQIDERGAVIGFEPVDKRVVKNQSGSVRSWRFSIPAPDRAGIYRLEIRVPNQKQPITEEFIVQDRRRRRT